MAKDLFIGNTDHEWFEFCQNRQELDFVNFWRPSRQPFKALEIGGIFFFRRKSPINQIGGFGEFVSTGQISIKDAWHNIGEANGVESLEVFVSRVAKYRKSYSVDQNDLITFNLLRNPVFLDADDWFDLPPDWSPNIVTGKAYDGGQIEGYKLIQKALHFQTRIGSEDSQNPVMRGFAEKPASGYSISASSKIRIGQGAFRLSVVAAYDGRCAVTNCSILQALEAAHIEDFSDTQNNDITNGILLRKDIHSLFDAGLLSFTPDYRVVISEKLKNLYPDAIEYHDLDGKAIRLPRDKEFNPRFQS